MIKKIEWADLRGANLMTTKLPLADLERTNLPLDELEKVLKESNLEDQPNTGWPRKAES